MTSENQTSYPNTSAMTQTEDKSLLYQFTMGLLAIVGTFLVIGFIVWAALSSAR